MAEKQATNRHQELITLPFDLYSRHFIAAAIINGAIRNGQKKLAILDLGGYNGMTGQFFKNDTVTVLDIYDEKETPNYIKGDATNLKFKDNSYDVVTSFDVFEHIPKEKRAKFISEAVRVASEVVIMTFPVDDKSKRTSTAEKLLDDFFLKISGKHHPWLIEHIEYGTPSNLEVEDLMKKTNLPYIKALSNDIELWESLQAVNFLGVLDSESLNIAEALNKQFNKNIDNMEWNTEYGYRGIYIIFKNPQLHSKTIKFLESKQQKIDSAILSNFKSKVTKTLMIALSKTLESQRNNTLHIEIMKEELADKNNHLIKLQNELKDLIDKYHAVLQSTSWKVTKPLRKIKRTKG